MDHRRHIVKKYLIDEKTHAAINSKRFKKLDHVNNSLLEVELAKAQTEHTKPITVGFFILHYAKLRMLELYHNFFIKFCDENTFEDLEMNTELLFLAFAEKDLEDCIRPEMRVEWERLQSNYCIDSYTANALANLLPRTCCVEEKLHCKRERGLFKEEFRYTETLCQCGKTYCCSDVTSDKHKLSSKSFKKRVQEQRGSRSLENYHRVLNKKVDFTANNRGFRTNNHSVVTYEQFKKSLPYFFSKRTIESNGILN